jgi:hypothetical protein
LGHQQKPNSDDFNFKFNTTCGKYPFVQKYFHSLDVPHKDVLIYSFYESKYKKSGGLGDRLAGMVSAIAFALRSDRTFLIQGDSTFSAAFKPFGRTRSWSDWKTLDWQQVSKSKNTTVLLFMLYYTTYEPMNINHAILYTYVGASLFESSTEKSAMHPRGR